MGVPAIHPFKIVEQRPVEIAAHRDALADGSMEPDQVFQQGLRATRVCRVAHAVLGDVERLITASAPMDSLHHPIDALWIDFLHIVRVRAPIVINRSGMRKTADKSFSMGCDGET